MKKLGQKYYLASKVLFQFLQLYLRKTPSQIHSSCPLVAEACSKSQSVDYSFLTYPNEQHLIVFLKLTFPHSWQLLNVFLNQKRSEPFDTLKPFSSTNSSKEASDNHHPQTQCKQYEIQCTIFSVRRVLSCKSWVQQDLPLGRDTAWYFSTALKFFNKKSLSQRW